MLEMYNYGFTPLYLATLEGHVEIVKALLEYNMWVNTDVVVENMTKVWTIIIEKYQNGQTTLHIVAPNGKFSIVNLFFFTKIKCKIE